MKNKYHHFLIVLASIILLLFHYACDKIDAPYTETTINPFDTSQTIDTTIVYKNFLLEDFTGHKCPNCPTAAKTADSLKNIYKDRLIVLSIHAGYFSSYSGTAAYSYNFRTTTGTELNTFFNINAYPSGLINRKLYGGKRILDHTDWPGIIAAQISDKSEVDIKIEIEYDSISNNGNVKVTNTYITNQNRVNKLSVFVMEDSIVAWQKNSNAAVGPTPDIENYLHKHVLRNSLNGIWGDSLNTTNVNKAYKSVKTYPLSLEADWKKKHCYIIAFVYDSNTLEILHVVKKKIISII